MTISPNGTSVNTCTANRFTILSAREYAVYTVSDPVERAIYNVYLSGMSRCDCGAWLRLGRCPHIDAARLHRDAELDALTVTPKPRRTKKRIRLSSMAVKRRPSIPSIQESMEALAERTAKAAVENTLRVEVARQWDAILGADGGAE
jgi:hypothetical protein